MQTDTKSQILEAAKKIFIQKGFDGARMQEIADEAKINKSMLHYYFRNKEELFETIVDDNMQIMAPRLVEALQGEGSVIEKMEKFVCQYIDAISENPHFPLFFLYEISRHRLEFINRAKGKYNMQPILLQFFQQITEEQQKGILKPIPPQQMMLSLISMVVFPFVAKPIFLNMMNLSENMFKQMIEERKAIVPQMLRDSFLN